MEFLGDDEGMAQEYVVDSFWDGFFYGINAAVRSRAVWAVVTLLTIVILLWIYSR